MINSIFSIAANPYALGALSFAGGYALNKVSMAINQIAAKRFALPIDLHRGKEYSDFVESLNAELIEKANKAALERNLDLDTCLKKAPGIALWSFTTLAIKEEYVYRHLLEHVVLPAIFPQFAAFSLARTCVSSLYFASIHLTNPGSAEQLRGQFCNTFVLGVVCSIAQEKFGLLAAIFTHVGFNLYGWQYATNSNFFDTFSKIKALEFSDYAGCIFLTAVSLVGDIIMPFLLTSMAAQAIFKKNIAKTETTHQAFA